MSLSLVANVHGLGDRLLRQTVTAVVLLFPSLCLLLNRSDSAGLALLALIGLWITLRDGFSRDMSSEEWLFVAAFVAFFAVGVLAFEFGEHTNAGFRMLGRYFRLLCVLPMIVALKRYPPAPLVVWGGLGLGALALGVDALWEWWRSQGLARPAGNTDVAILFGDLATLTTFVFVAGHTYIDRRLPRLGPALVALGAISGLTASLLSGVRGAWVAMPVLLVLLLLCSHILRTRTVLRGGLVLVLLFAALYVVPQTQVRDRISEAAAEVRDYYQVTDGLHRVDGGRRCMDQRGVLRAWISAAIRPPDAQLYAVQEQGVQAADLAAAGCADGVTVRIRNSGAAEVAVQWPRVARDTSGMAEANFLVRGQGSATFYASIFPVRKFSSARFIPLRIVAPPSSGGSVRFNVPPEATLSLVPIETFGGEYRYMLMRTPIGQRLEMWRAALLLFAKHPLLGVGTGGYQEATQQLVDAGRVAPDTARFDHPHNDYFDALANRGLLGLAALAALLGLPAWLFIRALRGPGTLRMTAGLGGLLVTVGFAIFGMTETIFIHSACITWYAMMTSIFIALANAPEPEQGIKNP